MITYNKLYKTYGQTSFKEKYFALTGRIGRSEYIMRNIWFLITSLSIGIILSIPTVAILYGEKGILANLWLSVLGIVQVIFAFFFLAIGISLDWRRFQDLGMNGMISLLPRFAIVLVDWVPLVKEMFFLLFIFYLLFLAIRKGEEGENKYGEDPQDIVIISKDIIERVILWVSFLTVVLGYLFILFNGVKLPSINSESRNPKEIAEEAIRLKKETIKVIEEEKTGKKTTINKTNQKEEKEINSSQGKENVGAAGVITEPIKNARNVAGVANSRTKEMEEQYKEQRK